MSNEATMLVSMVKHLQKLDLIELAKLNGDIAAINDLMKQAKSSQPAEACRGFRVADGARKGQ